MLRGGWKPHLKWNVGFRTLSPVDWVDQAGDYGQFDESRYYIINHAFMLHNVRSALPYSALGFPNPLDSVPASWLAAAVDADGYMPHSQNIQVVVC